MTPNIPQKKKHATNSIAFQIFNTLLILISFCTLGMAFPTHSENYAAIQIVVNGKDGALISGKGNNITFFSILSTKT